MNLLITLGHNSSAILLNEKNEIVTGYEEERLTRIKSDSSFPKNAIEECLKYYKSNLHEDNNIFISHWFDDYDFIENKTCKQKRFDTQFFNSLLQKYNFEVYTLNDKFTHHDAHAYSAYSFYKNHAEFNDSDSKINILIADGFGNREEVISIYEVNEGKITKTKKIRDYHNSLGLMYQYATDFIGFKMNQDEYKLLGYEPEIDNVLTPENIDVLNNFINIEYTKIFARIITQESFILSFHRQLKNEINLNRLMSTKEQWHSFFKYICDMLNVEKDSFEEKVVIAYATQSIIEKVVRSIIGFYNINDVLIVSGGIFYNVKLNNSLFKYVNKLCVPPLAGDQGAGIGVYEYFTGLDFPYKDLKWGKRKFYCGRTIKKEIFNNIYTFKNEKKFVNFVVDKLKDESAIVNIFTGDMEFGPRALCNTSTLALPTNENVKIINALNNRNEKMPMAPVILNSDLNYFFDKCQTGKIIGSEKYMIITFLYNNFMHTNDKLFSLYSGILHKLPLVKEYSGRPQVVYDKKSIIYSILSKTISLINTSFNVHGKPIVFSGKDAVSDFEFQWSMKEKKNINKNIYLVIGEFNDICI
jgi:carbamoyltransferase